MFQAQSRLLIFEGFVFTGIEMIVIQVYAPVNDERLEMLA